MRSGMHQQNEEDKAIFVAMLMMVGSWFLPFAAVLVFLSGCSTETGHPPVARLSIEPRYIPVNVMTLVTLDGRSSCDELDHPEGCDKTGDGSGPEQDCPGGVSFQWTLDRPVELVEGGWEEPLMKVRVITDRPIQVILKVRDCDGNTAEVRGRIGVILDWPDASLE